MQSKNWNITFSFLAMMLLAPALGAETRAPRQPVARMGDEAIYEEDLLPSIGVQLLQLKNQEYELQIKAVKSVVNQRLLDSAAKAKGLSREAFLQEVVDKNVPPPSASEIEGYYLAQKDRLNQPLDQVKPQVEQGLIQAKRQRARQDYIDRLYQNAGVSVFLSRPRARAEADPSRLRGSADAPVTIVEFADYQCPYCGNVEEVVLKVVAKYQGKVRFGFRDFPLRQIHSDAERAAEASRCAGEQGKFWEYHDLLFANQVRLEPNGLREYAQKTGLDVERFGACLASGKFAAQIESDIQSGLGAGVSSTPTFFVNGIAIVGAQPASAFENVIDSELRDANLKKPAP
jgi:predicted DsbA family dithiol-disulfide isomerase